MIQAKIESYNNHNIPIFIHDAKSKNIVIFCHGYRGNSIGPNRTFVKVAQKLESIGITSLRFDQYGCGNTDGDFFDSSFKDWIDTTKAIANDFLNKGNRVILFGQSMGASTVIAAGSEIQEITAVVAWVPDPNIEDFTFPECGYIEEGGQRVRADYWQQAHEAKVAEKLRDLKSPTLIIQCTDDEYVDEMNRKSIIENAQSNHTIINFEGYKHSSWSYNQSEDIINKSVDFIVKSFNI